MKLNSFVGGIGVLSACFLSGCAATTTVSEETVNTTAFDASVHFAKDSISRAPVTQNDIVNAVASAVDAGTRYRFEKTWTGDHYNFRGLYTTKTTNRVDVAYAEGDTLGEDKDSPILANKRSSKVSFSVDVDSVGENSAKIKFGPEVSVRHGTQYQFGGSRGIPVGEIASTETLAADLRNILSNPRNIVIHRFTTVSGEINVSFNSESTYANFLRIFGAYQFQGNEPKNTDIDKFAAYNYQVGNKTVPLYVNVMPYRNGSKVMYKMNVPYELLGNGVQTIGLNDINEAKKKIAAVAND